MSKNKKHKHIHKHHTSENNAEPKSHTPEEESPISLDEHLAEMDRQSMTVQKADMAPTTVAKASDVAPEEVKTKEKPVEEKKENVTEEKTVERVLDEADSIEKSSRVVWAFGAGLVIGALIISLLI